LSPKLSDLNLSLNLKKTTFNERKPIIIFYSFI
jgi:hypothetical protein